MKNLSPFCPCKNQNCPVHPTKHDQGCSPCISKNLRLKEFPNCFSDLVKNVDAKADNLSESGKPGE